MPFLYTYLIDENGDYILDENGDRIIIDSVEYSDGTPWRRIASSIRRDIKFVRSFEIRPNPHTGNTFMLVVNQKQLVGMNYPTLQDAISVLYGVFTRSGGRDARFQEIITYQLSNGISSIETGDPEAPSWTSDPLPNKTNPMVTDTVRTSGGSFRGVPSPTKTYQWLRDGANISGANTLEYTIVSDDIGAEIGCRVTLNNTEGSATTVVSFGTAVTDQIPASWAVDPTASEVNANQGTTLSVSGGIVNGNPTPTVTYTWRRNGLPILGATTDTYTTTSADAGQAVTCSVTATNVNGAATVQVDFGTIVGVDTPVASIRIFLSEDLDPDGEVTTPVQGKNYWVAGYDSLGAQVTPANNIVWTVS